MPNTIHLFTQGASDMLTRLQMTNTKANSSWLGRLVATVSDVPPMLRAAADGYEVSDETITPAARASKVAAKFRAMGEYTTAALNRAGDIMREYEADMKGRENARLGFTKGNPDRAAIVAKFSGMSQGDQMRQLGAWLKDGAKGGAMLGIVFEADPFLTGLTPETSAKMRSDYVKAYAPDLADERDMIEEGHNTVISIALMPSQAERRVVDPAKVADIDRRKAASDAADVAFRMARGGA